MGWGNWLEGRSGPEAAHSVQASDCSGGRCRGKEEVSGQHVTALFSCPIHHLYLAALPLGEKFVLGLIPPFNSTQFWGKVKHKVARRHCADDMAFLLGVGQTSNLAAGSPY